MALRLQGCSPVTFTQEGGGRFTLSGDFPSGQPLTVQLRSGGLTLTAYSGVPGQGSAIYPLGGTAYGIFPLAPEGAPASWTLQVSCAATGESVDYGDPIALRPPFFCSQTYELRSMFPPVDATGPRALVQEAFPWSP